MVENTQHLRLSGKIFHWSISLARVSSKHKLKIQKLDSLIFTLFEVEKVIHPASSKISPLCLKLKGFPIQHEKSRFPPSCFLFSPAGTPPLPGSPTPNDNEREGEQPTSLFGNYIRFLPNQHQPAPTHPFLTGCSRHGNITSSVQLLYLLQLYPHSPYLLLAN